MANSLDFNIQLSRQNGFLLNARGAIRSSGITAITGPSGSGKTTFLRALAGFERDGPPTIAFNGQVWDGADTHLPTEQRNIGYVSQEANLFPHLTVMQNLSFGAMRSKTEVDADLMKLFELQPVLDRYPSSLSGGEAKRVALVRAFACNPDVMFLDEPFVGLDDSRKYVILPLVSEAISKTGIPVLFVTHDQDEIATLADRVVGFEDGKFVDQVDQPTRIFGRVVSTGFGNCVVRLDGSDADDCSGDIEVPTKASVGDLIGIGLRCENVQISKKDPGDSTATSILPLEVINSEGGVCAKVFDQDVSGLISNPLGGGKYWLSIIRMFPRIEHQIRFGE